MPVFPDLEESNRPQVITKQPPPKQANVLSLVRLESSFCCQTRSVPRDRCQPSHVRHSGNFAGGTPPNGGTLASRFQRSKPRCALNRSDANARAFARSPCRRKKENHVVELLRSGLCEQLETGATHVSCVKHRRSLLVSIGGAFPVPGHVQLLPHLLALAGSVTDTGLGRITSRKTFIIRRVPRGTCCTMVTSSAP